MSIERPVSGRASRRARRKELDDAAVPGDRHCKRKVREKQAAIGLAQREEAGARALGRRVRRQPETPEDLHDDRAMRNESVHDGGKGAGVMLGKKSGRLEKDPAQAIPLRTLSPSIPAGAR